MLVRLAISVWPARYIVARVRAPTVDAGEQIVAIVVRGTLVLGHGSGTTTSIRIAHCPLRTFANVIAFRVDAIGTVSARIIRALVHIHATVLRIPLVTSLAHAPRWIAWRAFRVYAAWKSVARI